MKKESWCGSFEIFVVARAWTMAWRELLSFGNEMLLDALNGIILDGVLKAVER
jgi:hypothetical protein